MRKLTIITIFLTVMVMAIPAQAGDEDSKMQGTEEGARQVIKKFMKADADLKALLNARIPKPEDYEAVFVGDAVQRAQKKLASAPWDDEKFANNFAPKEGHTELLLYSATTEDFKDPLNKNAENFPRGYMKEVEHFKSGVTWYCWKFVKPGETKGWPMSALTYVNGRWVLFLKAYSIVRP